MRRSWLDTVATLNAELATFATEHGFAPSSVKPHGNYDRSWSFVRTGLSPTELLIFRARNRPRAILDVTFLASGLPESSLAAVGLEGHARGFLLFHFQVYRGSAAHSLLPQNIPIGPRAPLPATLSRLRTELVSVFPQVWPALTETAGA